MENGQGETAEVEISGSEDELKVVEMVSIYVKKGLNVEATWLRKLTCIRPWSRI